MGKNDYEKQLSKILKSVAYERYGYQVKKISKDRNVAKNDIYQYFICF